MWGWFLLLVVFAKTFADGPVTKKVHKHVTQSAMVVYIFHRLGEEIWIQAFQDNAIYKDGDEMGSKWDRIGFCGTVLIFNFASCFLVYGLLQTNWVTRKMFGITL